MNKFSLIALILFATLGLHLFSFNDHVFAIGEIFKTETTGTEYCDDFEFNKFDADNNIDLWLRIDSPTQLTVSLTQNFDPGTTFFMIGESYFKTNTKGFFVAGAAFDDGSWATIEGNWKNDDSGAITRLKGRFIQNSIFAEGCFSSGKFNTKERLQ